jgi:hypothetical protein
MWPGWAQSRCRCGSGRAQSRSRCGCGEPSPGADVAGVSAVPVPDVAGMGPVPVQMWLTCAECWCCSIAVMLDTSSDRHMLSSDACTTERPRPRSMLRCHAASQTCCATMQHVALRCSMLRYDATCCAAMPRAVARFEAGCSMSHLHSGFLLKLRKHDRKLRQHRLRERGRAGGRACAIACLRARVGACVPCYH